MPNLKRSLDIVISLFGIIISLPLLIIVSLLILVTDGRPIFFIQSRPGLGTKVFSMVKFRTMDQSAESISENDKNRITKLGSFLRSSSIDELPELFNVLLGDMSIVGPRPLLVEYLELYDDYQIQRHEVKPGITGWAQINGRNALEWEDKFKLDVWYVKNQCTLLDLKIIFKTLVMVLSRKDISYEGEATMKKFEGNSNRDRI